MAPRRPNDELAFSLLDDEPKRLIVPAQAAGSPKGESCAAGQRNNIDDSAADEALFSSEAEAEWAALLSEADDLREDAALAASAVGLTAELTEEAEEDAIEEVMAELAEEADEEAAEEAVEEADEEAIEETIEEAMAEPVEEAVEADEETIRELPEPLPAESVEETSGKEASEELEQEVSELCEDAESDVDAPPADETDEDLADEADAENAALASFLSIFRRKAPASASAEEPETERDDSAPQSAESEGGDEAEELSEEPEQMQEMVEAPQKKRARRGNRRPPAQSGEGEELSEPQEKALRVSQSATPATLAPTPLPREPKAGEMLVYDTELDDIDYYDDDDLPELRDYMPVRFSRHGRWGIGGGIMYALFVISASIILACFLWLVAADVLALNKPDNTAVVTIQRYAPTEDDLFNEDGDPVDENGRVIYVDMEQVSSALKSAGVIDFKWMFEIFGQLSHAYSKINPGTYDVSTKLDYRALVTEMQVGSESQEITRITFPEGYNMEQIFQLLEDNGICDKEDLYKAAATHDFNYDWLEDLPLGDATRLEGYLFPDTYDFYQGENAINAIDRFLNRFHYMLTMDMLKQAENLGISLHEAVIIASLIEKEAGAEDDRSRFASAIYNRLDDGWPLQIDATINYIKGTSTLLISNDDLAIDDPYNTYLYTGLPPGPICSPGKASLQAALNPANTNDWFWYAHEGVTYFFSSSSAFDSFVEAHPISG